MFKIVFLVLILAALSLSSSNLAKAQSREKKDQRKANNLEICLRHQQQISQDLLDYVRLIELRVNKVTKRFEIVETYYDKTVSKKGKSLKDYQKLINNINSIQEDLKQNLATSRDLAINFSCSDKSSDELKKFKNDMKNNLNDYRDYKRALRRLIRKIIPLLPPEEKAKLRKLKNNLPEESLEPTSTPNVSPSGSATP